MHPSFRHRHHTQHSQHTSNGTRYHRSHDRFPHDDRHITSHHHQQEGIGRIDESDASTMYNHHLPESRLEAILLTLAKKNQTKLDSSNAKMIDELINTTKPAIAAPLSVQTHSTAEITIEKVNVTSVDSTACHQRSQEESNKELYLAYGGVDIASLCPSGVT